MWACQKKGWKGYTDAQLKENHFKIAKALIEAEADINREAKASNAATSMHLEYLCHYRCKNKEVQLGKHEIYLRCPHAKCAI